MIGKKLVQLGLTYDDNTTLTATRWYRRLAHVTCSANWIPSNVLEVTVKPLPTLASITATPNLACAGSNVTITVNGLLDGINTISYDYTYNGSTTSAPVDLTASGGYCRYNFKQSGSWKLSGKNKQYYCKWLYS